MQLPTDSDLAVKTGSADITVDGQVTEPASRPGPATSPRHLLRQRAGRDRLRRRRGLRGPRRAQRIKSGSGDVSVGTCLGNLQVSTGSGDVEVGTSNARAVVKTGSGDLQVATANADVSLSTGSGDLTIGTARRGKVSAKGASSDVRIGIPAGTPVWADINTVTGSIRSDLESVGAPQEGQDHIELQARTVSGDIVLRQV